MGNNYKQMAANISDILNLLDYDFFIAGRYCKLPDDTVTTAIANNFNEDNAAKLVQEYCDYVVAIISRRVFDQQNSNYTDVQSYIEFLAERLRSVRQCEYVYLLAMTDFERKEARAKRQFFIDNTSELQLINLQYEGIDFYVDLFDEYENDNSDEDYDYDEDEDNDDEEEDEDE